MAASGMYELTRFTALAAGDVLPAVDISDTSQSAHGSLLSITVTNFFASIPVPVVVTSASAAALAVGLAGATNPAFSVDASTALQVAGLAVVGAVTGGTVAVVVRDSGSNANLTINAKGTGTIGIGSVSTGRVTITPATTITGALTQTGLATFNGGLTMGAATTLAAQAVTATGLTVSAGPNVTTTVTIGGGGGAPTVPTFAQLTLNPPSAAGAGLLGESQVLYQRNGAQVWALTLAAVKAGTMTDTADFAFENSSASIVASLTQAGGLVLADSLTAQGNIVMGGSGTHSATFNLSGTTEIVTLARDGSGPYFGTTSAHNLRLVAGNNFAGTITTGLSLVWGTAALATNATDGFVYHPSSAGAPTGVPTAFTGRVPIHYDTTNHKLWVYDGGWKGTVLS